MVLNTPIQSPLKSGPTAPKSTLGDNESMPEILVDIIIACHSSERPLSRAVSSSLDQADDVARLHHKKVRVTVVAHNVATSDLSVLLTEDQKRRVRFLELLDVMSREVVDPAGGWGSDRGVDPVVIVEVQPAGQSGPALCL